MSASLNPSLNGTNDHFSTPLIPDSGIPEDEQEARSFFVRALYDFRSTDSSSLSFKKGAIIEVLTQLESGWWDGLLGNDIRGWFPSNYVEKVSDQEAEALMHGQDGKSSVFQSDLSSSRYTGLGLGQDFDSLRKLIGAEQNSINLDTFEQLAEATMLEPSAPILHSPQQGPHSSGHDGHRQSRTSDQSSHFESIMGRSDMPSNFSQTDISSLAPRSAAASVSDADGSRKFPAGNISLAEQERIRAHTISSAGTPFQQVEGRPRASTAHAMSPSSSANRKPLRAEVTSESDFWVPKVTVRGDIMYFNTRTGAQSRDLPSGANLSEDGPATMMSFFDDEEQSSGPIEENGQTVYHQDGASPWIIRTSDDRTLPFLSRSDHEGSSFAASAKTSHAGDRDKPSEATSKGPSNSTSSARGFVFKHKDEQDARDLQQEIAAESSTPTLHELLRRAGEQISKLAKMSIEPLGTDGLSEEDVKVLPLSSDFLEDDSRMGRATRDVVISVRDVLHAAGALNVGQMDLVNVIQTSHTDANSASGSALSFQSSIVKLQNRNSPMDSASIEPHVAMGLASGSITSPPVLLALGKRINATLSKLVLSARSVIEQSCFSSEKRPQFSQAQLERILSYRQRIRDDSVDLARTLAVFSQEIEQFRASLPSSSTWGTSCKGDIRSAQGIAGVGADILGGGSAAGWRANGFVLPTPIETAALRAEAQGSYSNPFELTREVRDALSSGKVALRRKPMVPLSRSLLDSRLSIRFNELQRHLRELKLILQDDDGTNNQDPRGGTILLEETQTILSQFGAMVLFIEELDLASHLDVDGHETPDLVQPLSKEYQESVELARETLHTLSSVKQGTYDASNLLLLLTQDDDQSRERQSSENLWIVEALASYLEQMQEALISLAKISETQRNQPSGSIGARAKVYGIEDVQLRQDSRPLEDVMYLGPGLSVPNGPRQETRANDPTTHPGAAPRTVSDTKPEGGRNLSRSNTKAKRVLGDEQSTVASTTHTDAVSTHSSNKQVEAIPWFLQNDTPSEDIVVNDAGQVKGATLNALMERLTMHNAFDPTFNSTFLLTYQSFTTTDEFLDLLFARFRTERPSSLSSEEQALWVEKRQRPIQFRVFNVLKAWIESHYDERQHASHLQRIKEFAMDEMVQFAGMTSPANLLLRNIERKSGVGEQMKITMVMPASAPPPLLPRNLKKIKFLDIDPLEMARQLTLIDSRLYNRIRPSECLNKSWSRENGTEIAKGIRDVISANNRVSGWVSEAILVQEDLKKRANWVKHFVAIADVS